MPEQSLPAPPNPPPERPALPESWRLPFSTNDLGEVVASIWGGTAVARTTTRNVAGAKAIAYALNHTYHQPSRPATPAASVGEDAKRDDVDKHWAGYVADALLDYHQQPPAAAPAKGEVDLKAFRAIEHDNEAMRYAVKQAGFRFISTNGRLVLIPRAEPEPSSAAAAALKLVELMAGRRAGALINPGVPNYHQAVEDYAEARRVVALARGEQEKEKR